MTHLLHHFFPDNESFAFEAMRAAGYANAGAADLAEVIAICSQIKSGNEDQWLAEWRQAGDRALQNGDISLSKGNRPSARESYLRASNYYRTAEFYRREHPTQDFISTELASLSCEAFSKAVKLMPYETEAVEIPYEGTTLPGILMKPEFAGRDPKPLIIVNGGFDSTKEEVFYSLAPAALQLGMNVLAFEGPGQGDVIRRQGLVFRPDWEKVITPVVDFALAQPCVDSSRIVLVGVSMGSYLAARASAFEHRLAAVILNDGVFDFGASFRRNRSKDTQEMRTLLHFPEFDGPVNAKIRESAALDTGLKWAMSNAKYTLGIDTECAVIREMQKYTLEEVVELINTPTLVLDAPDDHFLKNQPQQLYDRLKCDKTLVALTEKEGGSLHCHIGAGSRMAQVTFDWLLDTLAKV